MDDDRWDWLGDVRREGAQAGKKGCVIACSALRVAYRDILRDATASNPFRTLFIHLTSSASYLESLMALRSSTTSHFMKPNMLASQLATLESFSDMERASGDCVEIDIEQGVDGVVIDCLKWVEMRTKVAG